MKLKRLMEFAFAIVISSICLPISKAECPADKEKDWSYDVTLPNGPPNWGKKYPDCKGKAQSPINIVKNDAESGGKRQKLKVDGYNVPIDKVKIMNNGHLIMVHPQDGKERSINLDGKKYVLQHFHFHWGNETNKEGSEDEIDGQKTAMEVHLVHKDSSGKLVVIGSLLEENGQKNVALESILEAKQGFEYEGMNFAGQLPQKFKLEELVDEKCLYYEYSGSMGFPPCTEGVTWLICRTNKGVQSNQLNKLYSIYSVKKGTADAEKCHLTNIFRPVQPLNGRKVKK